MNEVECKDRECPICDAGHPLTISIGHLGHLGPNTIAILTERIAKNQETIIILSDELGDSGRKQITDKIQELCISMSDIPEPKAEDSRYIFKREKTWYTPKQVPYKHKRRK